MTAADRHGGGEIGLVGLGTMGTALALNLAGRGVAVAGYEPLASPPAGLGAGPVSVHGSLAALVDALAPPRALLLMVTAGAPVDAVLTRLVPLLAAGDTVVDGGNSFFLDSERRGRELAERGLHYVGLGVSGGESGARHGPSLMAGGDSKGYQRVAPALTAIAARADGEPCCAYLGPGAAGHYVKMVHNGIEYADMQLIGEIYDLLRVLGVAPDAMAERFDAWNRGELNAYLTEITAAVLRTRDSDGVTPLLDRIVDRAGQKGTGRWTAASALELGVPAPTLLEAVSARALSALKEQRIVAGRLLDASAVGRADPGLVDALPGALLAARVCALAQGFALLRAAGEAYRWPLDGATIARVWRAGCIIRSALLTPIAAAYDRNPKLYNLFFDAYFQLLMRREQLALRRVVASASALGVPVAGLASALSYFDAFRRERLPANLIQAQRDYFGAHGYQRVDREGTFSGGWS